MTDRESLVSEHLLTKAGRRKLAEAMVQPARGFCPVCCRGLGRGEDFIEHCDAAGDDLHLAASVMGT